MGGTSDELADPTDVDWLAKELKEHVIFYKQYNMGHMTFAIGKDMSFFNVDALNILKQYATTN